MKRIFVLALVATTFVACNEQKSTDTTTVNSDTAYVVPTEVASTYTASEGDAMYRDGKVMVWTNGAYVPADKDVTLDDGIVIKRNGEATRNGVVVKLEEGETVTKTGRFFNNVGEAIDDGWDATKRGVNKAGDAIKKGANKVGEEVNDVVN